MTIQEARPVGLAIAPPMKQSGVPRPRPGLSQGTPTEETEKGFSSSLQEAVSLGIGNVDADLSTGSKRIKVDVDDQSHRLVAVIVDSETNEVIREIPPEQMVDLSARLQANIGAVFNRMA